MNAIQNYLMTKDTSASASFRLPFAARVVSIAALFSEGNVGVSGSVTVTLGDAPGFQFVTSLNYVPAATDTVMNAVAGGNDDVRTVASVGNSVHIALPNCVLPANCLVQCAIEGASAFTNQVYINIDTIEWYI